MRHRRSNSAILSPRLVFIAAFILFSVVSAFPAPVSIPTPTDQAVQYSNISNFAWGINQILTLLLPLAFLALGAGPPFSTRLSKHGKYRTILVFATIFFFFTWLIQLPLTRFRTNTLDQTNGDPSVPILQWIIEQLLGSLPLIIFSILAALFICWLINKSPQRWWLWATGVFSILFLAFLVGEPFTKNYEPLGETPLEVRISELAARVGIPRGSIVLEKCEPFDSCDIAHVSGLGPTRLILLNEGLLTNYPEDWTIQTVAHEAKHFVKDDNLVGWFVLTFIFFACFWLLDRVGRMISRRYSSLLGFTAIGQPAALPLLILVLKVIYLIALPPVNLFRQHVEFEADRYGLELTHENQILAEMVSSWTKGSKVRVPDPSPFFLLFRSSHPSDAERISLANEYQSKEQE